MRETVGWLGLVLGSITIASCRAGSSGPYSSPCEVSRSTVEAERLSREGADLADREPEKAEALLREALSKDLFYGPAHNNLGVLYLKQDKLYEAANEFEWARKLLPGHPDPRVNLALTLERAGKTEEAFGNYKAALEVYPDYLPAIEGLASLTVRTGKEDDRLAGWLDAIALRADSKEWRDWALRTRK